MKKSPNKNVPVNYDLIRYDRKNPDANPESRDMYALLEDAITRWHKELVGCRIALAWRRKTKADRDGHLVLGRCVKVSGVHREMLPFDFIIVLNKEMWCLPKFGKKQKMALLDHELCHAAPSEDTDGNQRQDEKGRKVWRVRKHDIEEFRSVVRHHGCYKADLEAFVRELLDNDSAPLFVEKPKKAARPPAEDGKAAAAADTTAAVQ